MEEECNSSESGWTMYIGSPSNGEDDDELENDDFDELEDNNNKEVINRDDNEDGDTDDSMASDASSGPSHRQYITKNGKIAGQANVVHYKNPKEKGKDYKVCGLNNDNNDLVKFYKANNSVKSGYKDEVKEEESGFTAKGAASNDSNKVRKSIWMGKGKK